MNKNINAYISLKESRVYKREIAILWGSKWVLWSTHLTIYSNVSKTLRSNYYALKMKGMNGWDGEMWFESLRWWLGFIGGLCLQTLFYSTQHNTLLAHFQIIACCPFIVQVLSYPLVPFRSFPVWWSLSWPLSIGI